MTEVFLDPTAELNSAARPLLPRLSSLEGPAGLLSSLCGFAKTKNTSQVQKRVPICFAWIPFTEEYIY